MQPIPGTESKVKHFLRFELFIPHLFYNLGYGNRPYVDSADSDWGVTVAIQSNDTFQRSKCKPPNSPTSTAFFEQVICSSSTRLPPVIWLELMRMAKDDGAFAPIDIDSLDSFPMNLCSRIVGWMMDTREDKDVFPRVSFEIAAQAYFIDELTANLLNMLSVFDKLADETSFSPAFKFALAFIRYLLHRVKLSSFDLYTQDAYRRHNPSSGDTSHQRIFLTKKRRPCGSRGTRQL
ncbi:uncharacterized protein EV420DRAFT_1640367 [Desarmillaria tabescens]|uniref:Uncharacterized protein n=1 Tax=Armillaria tabescens TaxID=1929756 RepID=A0AA39NAK1_ARMTA|nr:uncharacterized protein EV420DRAFT_1640367 [Desarmillaria tabescens]KAK0462082.1 hypothetical protein EV420DRAFT_1640367 [Desarmillaria tabescens]